MTEIIATCARCGDVELPVRAVRVRVCTSMCHRQYAFTCPGCGRAEAHAADERTVEVLLAAGASLTTWALPARADEPRSGDPIDHDDILDLHGRLHADDPLDAAVENLPARRRPADPALSSRSTDS